MRPLASVAPVKAFNLNFKRWLLFCHALYERVDYCLQELSWRRLQWASSWWMLLIGQKWDAAIGSDFDCQGIPNQSYVLEATSLVLSFQQTSLQYGLLCPTMKISRSAPLQRSMSHRHRHLSTEFIIFRIPSSTPNQNDTYNSAFLKCSRCN